MKFLSGIDMAEVTRLTRAGRLKQAMHLLRGLSGAPHDTRDVAGKAENTARGPGDESDILDMEPPSAMNGGVWTSTPPNARSTQSGPPRAADVPSDAPRPSLRPTFGRVLKTRAPVGSGISQSGMEVPAGARYEKRTYANAQGCRDYTIYVPSTYGARPMPLVVMLHGCKQSPDDFARGTCMNALAEEQGFLVAYPAQSQIANASRCWGWFNSGDQQRDRGEPALIAGITREVIASFAIDPGRVYIAGLSAGGAMAAIMGETYPDLYAAVGVHSGLAPGSATDIPSAFAAMRNGRSTAMANRLHAIPTIVFHGDADVTVHPLNADRVADHMRGAARGFSQARAGTSVGGIAYTRTVESDEEGRSLLEQWVLHGAGHAWSGGHASGSFVEPRGPDASRAMWRFFCEHAGQ